jgi:hypothetical protein
VRPREADRLDHAPAKHGDIKHVASIVGLLFGQEVEEQRREPLRLESLGDADVARD